MFCDIGGDVEAAVRDEEPWVRLLDETLDVVLLDAIFDLREVAIIAKHLSQKDLEGTSLQLLFPAGFRLITAHFYQLYYTSLLL